MKLYYLNDKVIARHIALGDIKQGLSFFSDDSEFLQIGTARYRAGTMAQAHIHNTVERAITKTCETFVVLQGEIEITLYDFEDKPMDKIVGAQGDIIVLLDGGHSLVYLQDDTITVEVKNGPFLGVDIDKRKF
jgi:hypothetical protein